MMLILHILPDLTTGGAEMMMKRLVESHLSHPEYEHRVISLRTLGTVGPPLQAQGTHVEALGLTSMVDLPRALFHLTRRIRAIGPDIVQTWMYHADLFGGLCAMAAGCRRIIWGVRIADIKPEFGVSRLTLIVRRACARLSSVIPKRIVYVAESARRIHEQLGYDRSKSIVIENGYKLPLETRANSKCSRLRNRLSRRESTILVGSAGRFNAQKDFRTFVRACAAVALSVPEAEFAMAGREINESNAELAAWIAETGCSSRFHLLGERRDLDDCLASMDIFCMHSLQEGFPNVVAEAMAAGTPCVVTDVGDAAALVADTGMVVPSGDHSALAEAITAMLRMAPSERRLLGERARARIAEHFSLDAIVAQYECLYAEVAPL